jgi:hypothetical protein
VGAPNGLFPPVFLHTTLYTPVLTPPNVCYMPRPSHSSRLSHPYVIWWAKQTIQCTLYNWTTLLLYIHSLLTLSLLMLYIYGAPCKARNFNVIYILTYVWQRWKASLSICCTMFQHWINAESYPVTQLCVNTLLAAKVTPITDGI